MFAKLSAPARCPGLWRNGYRYKSILSNFDQVEHSNAVILGWVLTGDADESG
jgi:hypothetical protein